MRSVIVVSVGVLLLLCGARIQAEPLVNPWGEPPAQIVLDAMQRYGVEQGPMVFYDEGTWFHASERSAVVAFETSERGLALLEWGQTAAYGQQHQTTQAHYIHIFYLTDLEPDTTYHVRMTAQDRQGTPLLVGPEITLTTRTPPSVVRIPADLPGGPPYVLDQDNTTYLLTEDVTADYTAFEFTAAGSTLDLGGHTVVYNVVHTGMATDSFNHQRDNSSMGVRAKALGANSKILNGTIIQGAGEDESSYATIGFNPIYVSGAPDLEIAGITAKYGGIQVTGICCHWADSNHHVHHNVVWDTGKIVRDREKMVSAIKLATPGGGRLHHNLVKRARQAALGSVGESAEVYHNELHIESYCINSFGVGVKDNSVVYGNRIFGCGDNVVGVATTGGCTNVEVYDNYMWLQAHDLTEFLPYMTVDGFQATDTSIMSGVRITWGSNGVEYHDNTIMVVAREGGNVRGTFLYADGNSRGAVIRDNLVIALTEDSDSDRIGAVGGVGNHQPDAVPIEFLGNTFASNFTNFSLKDSYGTSVNYVFTDSLFERLGSASGYATIRGGSGYASTGHLLRDSRFAGGAGFDQVVLGGSDSFTIQWTLTVLAPPDTLVTVDNLPGNRVHSASCDEEGQLKVFLNQLVRTGDQEAEHTPHTVTATWGGDTEEQVVFMDAPKTLLFFGVTEEDGGADEDGGFGNDDGPPGDGSDGSPDATDKDAAGDQGADVDGGTTSPFHGGCGCSSHRAPISLWLWLCLLMMLMHRRRWLYPRLGRASSLTSAREPKRGGRQ